MLRLAPSRGSAGICRCPARTQPPAGGCQHPPELDISIMYRTIQKYLVSKVISFNCWCSNIKTKLISRESYIKHTFAFNILIFSGHLVNVFYVDVHFIHCGDVHALLHLNFLLLE